LNRLVPPSKALGYSTLYLDYLAGASSARQFFLAPDIEDSVVELDRQSYDREKLTEILHRQNLQFGSSATALANVAKLADPKAVCVMAGQQAGLFGHSLLVQIKAIALAKKATQLAESLRRPVVPIFWIAGDDHDFAEIAKTFVLNKEGTVTPVSYQAERLVELPIGLTQISDGEALVKALAQYHEALGDSEFTPNLYELLDNSYTTNETFVTAFGKLMASLVGEYGVVLFSPTDAEVKKLAEPFLKSAILRNAEIRATVHQTNERILAAGYHLQVEKSDAATYLFHNGPQGRKPISRETGSFVVDDKKYATEDLVALLRSAPGDFSPDVILRPVMQSFLFPVLVQYGGPSEIAYLAQINPLFGLFGLPTPQHLSRPTATLIEKRFEKMLNEYDIPFEDLTGDVEQVINHVLEKSFPVDLESRFRAANGDIAERFDQLTKESLEFDPTLKDFAKQTAGKLDFALKTFEEKVFSSHKRKSKETRDRIYRLHSALYPNRAPQDRSLNIGYFIAKYGPGVISFLYDHMDVDETSHQLLYLSEMAD
jgi:bacillithiol synthase